MTGSSYTFRNIVFCFKYAKTKGSFWFYFYPILVLASLLSVCEALIITLLHPILTYSTGGQADSFVIEFFYSSFSFSQLVISFTLLIIITAFLKLIFQYLIIYSSYRIGGVIRRGILNDLMTQPHVNFIKYDKRDLETNLTVKVNSVSSSSFVSIIILFYGVTQILAIVSVLVISTPSETITGLLILSLAGLSFLAIIASRLRSYSKDLSNSIANIYSAVGGILGSELLVRFSNSLSFFDKRLVLFDQVFSKSNAFIAMFGVLPRTLIDGVILVVIIVFAMAGKNLADTPLEFGIGFDDLVIFAVVGQRIYPYVMGVVQSSLAVLSNQAIVQSICSLIEDCSNENTKTLNAGSDHWVHKKFHSLKIKKMDVVGVDGNTLLKGFDFEIHRGDVIGFSGPSGVGKTTLIKSLLGIVPTKFESAKVNDVALDTVSQLRHMFDIGIADQNFFFFDGSLFDNVAMGDPPDDKNKVRALRALDLAQCLGFLDEENPLEKWVVNNAYTYSGGQRSRLAIARALYNGSDVVILDEVTSSLDYRLEQRILEGIRNCPNGPAVLMISHRQPSLNLCDHIFLPWA